MIFKMMKDQEKTKGAFLALVDGMTDMTNFTEAIPSGMKMKWIWSVVADMLKVTEEAFQTAVDYAGKTVGGMIIDNYTMHKLLIHC